MKFRDYLSQIIDKADFLSRDREYWVGNGWTLHPKLYFEILNLNYKCSEKWGVEHEANCFETFN